MDTASGDVTRHETGNEDNFSQCGDFFRNVLNAAEKERLTDNIAGNLIGTFIRTPAVRQILFIISIYDITYDFTYDFNLFI